ncbi:MAG: DUF1697 domain-containing protein [Acidobacteria bacterium]|nr:DUF1697 domain-containing protein [Acidobacteriota bacterium]MCA1583573.1 DUF1697 domain-containing protein [Acidobacteriota bacterium]MCA1649763.1 DUF1697 domain-containing protein [Acidobacteriota bacterium]
MNHYVAFMRAINVAGHASVRISDVRDAFAAAGRRTVRTYIQSGNVIFESPAREAAAILRRAQRTLRHRLDNEPEIVWRSLRDIEALVRRAPFRNVEAGPAVKLYVTFLSRMPRSMPKFPLVSLTERLEAIAMHGREVFVVSRPKNNGSFGFPNNFIEKELGISATTRNWSTLAKIAEFAQTEANAAR